MRYVYTQGPLRCYLQYLDSYTHFCAIISNSNVNFIKSDHHKLSCLITAELLDNGYNSTNKNNSKMFCSLLLAGILR